MILTAITEGIPNDLKIQLSTDESVYYFSYISETGGCGKAGGERQNFWIALTGKRVIYKTKIKEGTTFIEKDGILPFDKISFLEVSEMQSSQGCQSQKGYLLKVSTSGGTVIIPIPTKEKCYEIRKVYTELNQ